MPSILLAVPPFMIRPHGQTATPVESDIFAHLRDSLIESHVAVSWPEWPASCRFSTADIEREIEKSGCDAILVEASYPKAESYLSGVDLRRIGRRVKVAAVVPDFWFRPLIAETLQSLQDAVETFLIFGNEDLIEPVLAYSGLPAAFGRRFVALGGVPVPRRNPAEKSVDFCYVGAVKKFRGNLLKSIVADRRLRTIICTAGRDGLIGSTGLERTAGYMDLLACAKSGLWTRAWTAKRIAGGTYAAGYTGRFNEYLAASVVPLFWSETRWFKKAEELPVAGLVEGTHYLRAKDARDLKLQAYRICFEPDLYKHLRRNIDDLYETRFSSRTIIARVLSLLSIVNPAPPRAP